MNRHSSLSLSTIAISGVMLASLGSLGACGDATGKASATPPSPEPAAARTEAFCASIVDVYTTMNRTFAGIDFATTSEQEFGRILRNLRKRMEPVYQDLEATVPAEIEEVAARRLKVGREALATGVEDDSPQALEDEHALDEFVLANCDVNAAPVALTDGGLEDVPQELPVGVTAFELRNDGTKRHDFSVFRVPDHLSTAPLGRVAASLPDLERVGGTDLDAGEHTATFVDLPEGRYVVGDALPGQDAAPESLTDLRVG